MNITDKNAFYREIHRVLEPGGWLALSKIAKGEGLELDYPTPWARARAPASCRRRRRRGATYWGRDSTSFDCTALARKLWRLARALARLSSAGRSRRAARRC